MRQPITNPTERPNRIGDCPNCGNTDCNLEYGALEVDEQCVYYPYTCPECGFQGREYHTLEFDSHTDNNGFEPQEKGFNK